MADFKTYSTHEVLHPDGWGFVVEEYDDGLIRLAHKERHDDVWKETGQFEGLWPDAAFQVADAMKAIAEQITGKKLEQSSSHSSDFQKGFYAGIAYAGWGEECIIAASTAAKRLAQTDTEGRKEPT